MIGTTRPTTLNESNEEVICKARALALRSQRHLARFDACVFEMRVRDRFVLTQGPHASYHATVPRAQPDKSHLSATEVEIVVEVLRSET